MGEKGLSPSQQPTGVEWFIKQSGLVINFFYDFIFATSYLYTQLSITMTYALPVLSRLVDR